MTVPSGPGGPPGILVVFEGIDGAGKTTHANRLEASLRADGYDVVRTKEPTDGPWGRMLRASATTGRLDAAAELDAFVRDRREHVDKLLRPSLDAGRVVILDRYYFSNAAYQGARGLDPEAILTENEAFAPQPDLLVLMEVPPEVGVARAVARGGSNLFERVDDLRRAAAIFARIQRPYLLRMDATLPSDEVSARVLRAVREGPLAARRLPRGLT